MDKGYIAPDTALKKLRMARSLSQTVYLYGATGYGKTELVRQYLKNRRYRYISCGEDAAALTALAEETPETMSKGRGTKQKEKESRTVAVLDDLHMLRSAEGRRAALALAEREDIWLILVCRSPVPAWLMPLYVAGGFIVITEEDLRLGEKEISAYMETQGVTLTEKELASVCKNCRGNTYAVRHTALKIQEGMRPGTELEREIEGPLRNIWRIMCWYSGTATFWSF